MLLWTLIGLATVAVAGVLRWLARDPPADPLGSMSHSWKHEQRQNRERL